VTARRFGRAPRSLRRTAAVFVLLSVLPECGAASRPSSSLPKPLDEGHARPATPPLATSSAQLPGSEAVIARSIHVALGIPRDADPTDDHYLDEQAFVVSYNREKRVPNWVAWRIERSDFGRARRTDDFRADLSLPADFYRVNESDYLHSGYDRGHLCPSADRKASRADNSRTFLFTNMLPQLHELNAGPWERLEAYARQRARDGQILYAVAGGVFGAAYPTIGNGVAVPAYDFKILVPLDEGQGPKDVSVATDVLAVIMPNQRGVAEHDWTSYLTTVDAIEQATGYDFLTAISEPVQRVIESRIGRPQRVRGG
jgi:endonuclease G, mitochondrial